MSFKKAEKSTSLLRLLMYAVSGAGKTYSALEIATGLAETIGGKIALIDTERGSASKYADRFEFDVCELEDRTVEGYVKVIGDAASAGYKVLIIDSLTHAWDELLELIDKLAKTKYAGNSFRAWAEGTPLQKKFLGAILDYPGHVICTARAKTEWVMETNDKGRAVPKKVGVGLEQRKGLEFEFDMIMEISQEHIATITKDRLNKYQDQMIEKPSRKMGIEMAKWLSEGKVIDRKPVEVKEEVKPVAKEQPRESAVYGIALEQIKGWLADGVLTEADIKAQVQFETKRTGMKLKDCDDKQIDSIMKKLLKFVEAKQSAFPESADSLLLEDNNAK